MSARNLVLLSFAFAVLFSCQTFNKEKFVKDVLQSPQKHLSNYKFDPSSSLISRVRKPEPFIMKYLQDMDGRPDYAPYEPTPKERKMIADALEKLPPLTVKTMKQKLVGIYFVNDLYGSGLSDWLIDDRGEKFVILVFNPITLKMGLSEWLTWKENSAFNPDTPGSGIQINCGNKYQGFYGILIHESAHGVDYILNINPFVEPSTLYYDQLQNKKIVNPTPFVKDIWQYANQPFATSDYPYRKKVSFYAAKKENLIPVSKADECYRGLESSPFVSLYGSQSWSEDLAEMVMFHHLVNILRQPYVIMVSNGNSVSKYSPMENPRVMERRKNIEWFYR